MKKLKENIKKQAKNEGVKALLVLVGAVGGVMLARGIRKFTEDKPTLDAVAQYLTPVVLAGGGVLITMATEEKSVVKGLGYGLAAAGSIEGVKLIPVAKDFLSGILGETEIPAASAFLTENTEREKLMSGFGISSLPVGNASMQEVPESETNLPELEGVEEEQENSSGDLGYNSSATDEVDPLKGVI